MNITAWTRLATGTVAVNMTAMGLAVITDDLRVFTCSYVGAAFAGYARIYFAEEGKRMGQTPMGFRNLAMALRWQIREDDYRPGDKLPSHRQLAHQHDTTRTTVRRALEILQEEGIVDIKHGRGTYILGPDRDPGERLDRATHVETHLRRTAALGLPIERAESLALTWSVSPSTVRRVVSRLVTEGVIRRKRNGTFEAA